MWKRRRWQPSEVGPDAAGVIPHDLAHYPPQLPVGPEGECDRGARNAIADCLLFLAAFESSRAATQADNTIPPIISATLRSGSPAQCVAGSVIRAPLP